MLRIAVCDDEGAICVQMKNALEQIGQAIQERVEIEVFYSGEELCRPLYEGIYFDIIFLDIELIVMNGVEVGRKIREEMNNQDTHIVYISGKDSYAMELFEIRPLNFLIKPLKYEKIEEVFKTALKLIQNNDQVFEYQNGRSYHRIPVKDILYFESHGKKIEINLTNGIQEFYGKLSMIETQLNKLDFISIHKSYLINYAHVIESQYDQVRMSNNAVLPISQPNRKQVRDRLLQMRQREEKNDA